MVTTSHGHWDGLAGNNAMFSEAVVPAAIVESLPTGVIETIFIKKNPQTRRFERAWRGKTKNFKRVNRQDRDYILFEVEDLKTFNCPESLRTKTVGCHIVAESAEQPQAAPKRPMQVPRHAERPKQVVKHEEEEQEVVFTEKIQIQGKEETVHLNGHSKHAERELLFAEKEPVVIEEPVEETPAIISTERSTNIIEPAFFEMMLRSKDPTEFEQHCFYLLRILGIHDLHRPQNLAGTDAHGFFKFNSLSVVYITTLVPAVVQDNPLVIDHYLNLLKKEKMRFATTSYTIKETQKQVWLLTNRVTATLHLRTDDGIKLKLVPVSILAELYNRRMNETELNVDGFWDALKDL